MMTGNIMADSTYVLKQLRIGLFVRHCEHGLCEVENFDVTKSPRAMPVRFKHAFTHILYDGYLADICGVFIDVDNAELFKHRPKDVPKKRKR